MRSPSISDSQDRSPGVIFQLPFGIQSANRSPPAVYPSPASSSTRSAATSNAGVELSGSERRPPPEPTLTHGLGIHVQAVFSEERVPHPFDTERISQGTDETVQTREVKHDLRMPTSQSDNLHGGFKDTLSPAMIEDRISAEISRAGCPSAGLRTSAETILSSKTDPDTLTVSESKNTNAQEPATMPLWAQRQLNIRRQSLIPRPELDFVSGSGILPPANKDLILPEGGATILMYPVLLSDIVKVAQDDYQDRPHGDQNDEEDVLSGSTKSNKRRKTSCTGKKRDSVSGPLEAQPYEIEARFNRTNDVTDNEGLRRPPPMQAVSLPEAKGAYLNMIRGTLDSPPSPMATMSPQSRYPARRQSALGSPVEISTLSTFAAGANPRHGSRSAIRHESLEDLSWEEDDYRSSHSQVDPLESNSAEPKKDHQKKGGAKGREQRLATATSPKSGVRKKSLHLAGPMQSTMDVDQNKSKRDERGSKSPQKRPLREEYGETPHTPLSKKSKKASAPQSYHSGQLATPQSDRHSLASSGLNEEFELASTLINMHDGMILDTHSVSHLSHDHNTPKVKKSRAPKPCLPNPAKASNGSHKKPTVMSMSKIHKTATPGQKHCEACGATETPCWRPGYTSSTVLCNSCGLRYKKANVYCTKPSCKYIPLKTEYAAMETERAKNGWNHLRCKECGERVELPVLKD
ncbi:DNA-binding transcription repressor [Mortierella sp. GBA30]|nr:DNA-binding transcription repressor [Mortierella sp. GBA30]